MDYKQKLIELLRFIEVGNQYNWDTRLLTYIFNYDLTRIINDYIKTLKELLNNNIIILDSDKIKKDVISSKTLLNSVKFGDNDYVNSVSDRYNYNISWNCNKVVNYHDKYINKEEMDKYLDDQVGQEFIHFLLSNYGTLKEEE